MKDTHQSNEIEALRNYLEVAKEYLTARDALWSLGLFDRIFRFKRCLTLLKQYEEAKDNVRRAFRKVENIATARAEADIDNKKDTPTKQGELLAVDEFEMLMGKPPILRNRFPFSRDKP